MAAVAESPSLLQAAMSPAASRTASGIGSGAAERVGVTAGDPVGGSVGEASTGEGTGESFDAPIGIWAHAPRARTIAIAGPTPATLLDRATRIPSRRTPTDTPERATRWYAMAVRSTRPSPGRSGYSVESGWCVRAACTEAIPPLRRSRR